MGIPGIRSKAHEGKVREGNILISVHTDDREEVKRAKEIFERSGATDIATAGEESVEKDEQPPRRTVEVH
jgi:hypothetical protein